jgi:hypothetical protein
LCDDKVGEYLLLSKSEQNLLDSEFDTENEFDECALLDAVVNDSSAAQDFICKTVRDKGKMSWAVLDLKLLQNILQKSW